MQAVRKDAGERAASGGSSSSWRFLDFEPRVLSVHDAGAGGRISMQAVLKDALERVASGGSGTLGKGRPRRSTDAGGS